MADLLWPGDERAGELFGDRALVEAMVSVEVAWLQSLVQHGVAPQEAYVGLDVLSGTVGDADLPAVAEHAAETGNPVVPLLATMRVRLEPTNPVAARWLHRGLTSQDTLDTGLMLCLRDALDRVGEELGSQGEALATLAHRHRDTPMAGRTLTQPAVPTTFGARVAGWLHGVLDAAEDVRAVREGLAVQLGGAAGTWAAAAELAGSTDAVPDLLRSTADALGLARSVPWHTTRTRMTRAGDALVRCTDAWGRIANDVLTASRAEIGELTEGRGGGSSTMPHKANPVLAVLLRRTALATPSYAAQLHLAAAEAVDDRPDGAWHLEWPALRDLGRRTASASAQATELVTDLRVHPERMRANLDAALPGILAEQHAMAELAGHEPVDDPARYLAVAPRLVDEALRRREKER